MTNTDWDEGFAASEYARAPVRWPNDGAGSGGSTGSDGSTGPDGSDGREP